MMPDPAFIAEQRDKLLALVITHAHEDHIGAVAHLWRQLRCPVYATPFAAAVLRRKLSEAQLLNEVKLHVVPTGGKMELAAVLARVHPHGALDAREPGAGRSARRTARSCIPAISSSTPSRWSARPRTRRRCSASATRACWRWCATARTRWSRGTPAPRPTCGPASSALVGSASRHGRIAMTCFASNVARVESIALRGAGRRAVGGTGRAVVAQPRHRGARDGILPDGARSS